MSSRLRVAIEDVVAVAVHLDPDAVELGVDRRLSPGTGLLQGGCDVRCAGGEHRQHRPPDVSPTASRPPRPSVNAMLAMPGRGAGQHRGTAYDCERHAGRLGDGLLDEGVERALPDLAGDGTAQPGLLVGGGAPEQVLAARFARVAGACARQTGHRLERLVHLAQRSATAVAAGSGRALSERQPRPVRRWRSDPANQLATIAISSGPASCRQRGKGGHLGLAGPRRRNSLGCLDDSCQQHGSIVPVDSPYERARDTPEEGCRS